MITRYSAAQRDRRVIKSPLNLPEVAKNLPPKFQNCQAMLKIVSIHRPAQPNVKAIYKTTSSRPTKSLSSSTLATTVAKCQQSYIGIARRQAKSPFTTHRLRTGTVSYNLYAYRSTMRKRYTPPRTTIRRTTHTRIGAEIVRL